jgi:hypothetical protein
MKAILGRVKLFLREILNLVTDLLVPVVDVLLAVAAVLPLPKQALVALHKLEGFLKQAGATLEDVIEEVQKQVK